MKLFGKALAIFVIAITFLLSVELGLRYFTPQLGSRVYSNNIRRTTPDHVLGYTLTPNTHIIIRDPEFYPDYEIDYKVNTQGFRDAEIYAEHKSAGKTRVLILGDSFAYGVANPYSKIWLVLLEQKLQDLGHRVEVIKAGVFGYDTRKEILYLKRLLPEFKPDIVILTFLPNDLFTNRPIETTSRAKPSNNSKQLPHINFRHRHLLASYASRLHLVALGKRLLLMNDWLYTHIYLFTDRGAFFNTRSPILQQQINVTKGLLFKGATLAKKHSFTFIVLSIPQNFQVVNTDESIDVDYVDRVFGDFAKRHDFTWISALRSLSEMYSRDNRDLYYRVDGHLNNEGNRVVSEFAVDKLIPIVRSLEYKSETT